MAEWTRGAKVGLFAIAAAGAGYALWHYVSPTAGTSGGYTIHAYLDDAQGLATYSRVMVAGIPVGSIESIRLEPFEPYRLIGLALAHHALGERSAADAVLAELIEKYAHDWSYNIAYIHAYREDNEGAFKWLDEAVRFADPGLSLIVVEPLFGNLHDDARWADFLRELGKRGLIGLR